MARVNLASKKLASMVYILTLPWPKTCFTDQEFLNAISFLPADVSVLQIRENLMSLRWFSRLERLEDLFGVAY